MIIMDVDATVEIAKVTKDLSSIWDAGVKLLCVVCFIVAGIRSVTINGKMQRNEPVAKDIVNLIAGMIFVISTLALVKFVFLT